ncbi:two-component sensor histidine kinase [Methylobacterium sp. OAE515]|uniref:sensor histidine kinase n=1 Tax=Methylobacterium sp. OAE515 TaxID=2817895 RepID=UPI00178921C9
MRVIVADDDPDTRVLNMRAIAHEIPDLDIVEVADPASLEQALSAAPDLLVTDYDLRWTDGFQILTRVRDAHPHCHAIMVTGTGNEDLAVRAMKAGFDDYIVKGRNQLKRLGLTARLVLERGQTQRALSENRDLVLAELYHRLHNNLQIVISLIRQTEKTLRDAADRQQLADLRQRIQALSSLQEQFYRSPDFRRVEFGAFLGELAERLSALAPIPVTLVAEIEAVELPVDVAVPFGLLANEIITNAVQHAFSDEAQGGRMRVRLQRQGDRCVLTVEDDGRGFESGLRSQPAGMGLHLVERLAQQIDGTVNIEDTHPGTRVSVGVAL